MDTRGWLEGRMMKLGFSSLACPEWDLETIIDRAAAIGYEAVELCGLRDEMHLPSCAALAGDPEAAAGRFREAGVELACLATANSLHWKQRRLRDEHLCQVREVLELAGRLHCPCVRILAGEIPRGEDRNAAMARTADALRELAPMATAHDTTIVLENGGDFSGSRDIWLILDSVSHPAVGCCWNPMHAMTFAEHASLSVPRLGTRIRLTRITDVTAGDDGRVIACSMPGEGEVDAARYLDVLRGIAFDGVVLFDWPRRRFPALPAADVVLPAGLAWLRSALDELAGVEELSAYKGDKHAAHYAPRREAGP